MKMIYNLKNRLGLIPFFPKLDKRNQIIRDFLKKG